MKRSIKVHRTQAKEVEEWELKYHSKLAKAVEMGIPITFIDHSILVPLECLDQFLEIMDWR